MATDNASYGFCRPRNVLGTAGSGYSILNAQTNLIAEWRSDGKTVVDFNFQSVSGVIPAVAVEIRIATTSGTTYDNVLSLTGLDNLSDSVNASFVNVNSLSGIAGKSLSNTQQMSNPINISSLANLSLMNTLQLTLR